MNKNPVLFLFNNSHITFFPPSPLRNMSQSPSHLQELAQQLDRCQTTDEIKNTLFVSSRDTKATATSSSSSRLHDLLLEAIIMNSNNSTSSNDASTNAIFKSILLAITKAGLLEQALNAEHESASSSSSGETLLMKCCFHNLNYDSFKLFVDVLSSQQQQDSDENNNNNDSTSSLFLNEILNKTNNSGSNFFMFMCTGRLSDNTFKMLIDKIRSSSLSSLKQIVEFKNVNDMTGLHIAIHKNMSRESLEYLIAALFDDEDHFQKVLTTMKNKPGNSKKWKGETPIELVDERENPELKKFLSDPEVWKKCRRKFGFSVGEEERNNS